jgi:hypothetical protein
MRLLFDPLLLLSTIEKRTNKEGKKKIEGKKKGDSLLQVNGRYRTQITIDFFLVNESSLKRRVFQIVSFS